MKISIRKKLMLTAFIILICISLIGYTVYSTFQRLIDSEEWVSHTERVLCQSGNVLTLAKDIESSGRGFVITGDSIFLKPLYAAQKLTALYTAQLRALTKDNPGQLQRIDSLSFYMQKRLDITLNAVELRNKDGLAPAITYISEGEDEYFTARIRFITNAIQESEIALLKQRKQSNEDSIAMFKICLLAMLILIVGVAVFLVIAIGSYVLQDEEKEKRAAELLIANTELAFQNREKEKRAEELVIADVELAFQNNEKEKRAAELIIANKELVFQNAEKEKRAGELIIANKELAFQNNEKEKRAAELILANKELIYQNEEKEKRAAELILANIELKRAEDGILKLNEELEQKVMDRTSQLEILNKELGSFSYSVSHDLRAPIRAINGYGKILEDDYGDKFDEDGLLVLHSIMRNSKKMGNLIDDLLAFSKLGRKEVTVSEINMTKLVNTQVEEAIPSDINNPPEFIVKDLPPSKGDASLIRQVWINLISNAIKYSKYKPKTHIEIGGYQRENLIIYYIKDNGAGFDMDYYDKLFGVFQRLHSQDEFEGTGIGLAIIHKVIQRHKGSVWAKSVLNEGSCFYFSLPSIDSKF